MKKEKLQVEPGQAGWPETWRTLLSWESFFCCHRCLLKPMSFRPLSADVHFPAHPFLWASLLLEAFFFWHALLSASHSLDMLFAWSHFACFLLFSQFFFWDISLSTLLSFETVSLDIFFVLKVFSFSCLSLVLSFCWHSGSLRPQFILCKQNLHFLCNKMCPKYFPALFFTKLAQRTSQYYFVLSHHGATCKRGFYFTVRWRTRSNASPTPCTNKVPPINAGSHFMRENTKVSCGLQTSNRG